MNSHGRQRVESIMMVTTGVVDSVDPQEGTRTDTRADAQTEAGRPAGRRRIAPAVAVVGVALVVVAALLGLRLLPGGQGAQPSGGPAVATHVEVLSVAQLRSTIAVETAGAMSPLDVVADVAIDTSIKTSPAARECDPVGACLAIGTLAGFDPSKGAVAIRREESVLPPATDPASLQDPVALRLTARGPIEFLGHYRPAPSGSATWTVAEALADTNDAVDGQVVGVDGWLSGATGFSCGPAPIASAVQPFTCGIHDYLTSNARLLVEPFGSNGYSFSGPADGIPVQQGAYEVNAPNATYENGNKEPRRAIYLLRMVVNPAGCPECRGWLLVGRLDAAPAPSTVEVGPTVRSAAELQALLAADRASWIGRMLYVDGTISRTTGAMCGVRSECELGTLQGTPESVYASAFTARLLPSDSSYATSGVMALAVRADGVEYLGYAAYNTDNSFYFTVGQLAGFQNNTPLIVVIVKGWLVDALVPCSAATRAAALIDTPFEANGCPPAWLAPNEIPAASTNESGTCRANSPAAAVQVQPEAYDDFAPGPAGAGGCGHVPRYGTFALRLVTNPLTSAYESGWQVVSRLSP